MTKENLQILRHVSIKNGYMYRGLAVAPGTALHEALSNKDYTLANKLYDKLKASFILEYGQEFWDSL